MIWKTKDQSLFEVRSCSQDDSITRFVTDEHPNRNSIEDEMSNTFKSEIESTTI